MASPDSIPRILLAQSFAPGRVTLRQVPSTFAPTPEASQSIEDQWERMKATAGLHLFDGPMCRLEMFHVEHPPETPPRLVLDISHTRYKSFLGTNLHGPSDLPPNACANPLGVSPALESADGYLLFGQRGDRVAYYPRRLHPFGGALEPAKHLDIFTECLRELNEELDLAADAITDMRLLGIVEDPAIRHPELILHVRCNLPKDAILAGLDGAEHDAAEAVAATSGGIAAALTNLRFTPVGRATLMLWSGQDRTCRG